MILLFFTILNLFILLGFDKIKLFKLNIDFPDNERKNHKVPTPLAGGTILIINQIIFWIIVLIFPDVLKEDILFENNKDISIFIFTSTLIFLLGFFDDKYNIKAIKKILILLIIILIFLFNNDDLIIKEIKFSFYGGTLYLYEFSIPFTIFCFLVFMNAFNMFDGINLQSTLYSLIILLSLIFYFQDSYFLKILIISLVFFLYLNSKNYSFLGDSGTLYLSFLLSYIFIKFYNLSFFSGADKIVIYMLIPGIDLIRLFAVRIINKKNPLSSDRNHLHHLLTTKYSLSKSLLILVTLILTPLFLDSMNLNNFINIIITVILYSIVFLRVK